MTGEQLEATSYDKHDCTEKCCECGTIINKETEVYGESINREKYCCYDCLPEFARLRAFKHIGMTKYIASARYDGEEISLENIDETRALKRLEELANYAWTVKSYVERG